MERVVATLHPNRTFEKVVFDAWRQMSFDVNDTVTFDPNGAVAKTFTISVKDSAGTQTLEATGTGVN